LGLGVASVAYPVAAAPIAWIFGPPAPIAAALGFLVSAVLVVFGASWGFSIAGRRIATPPLTDRIGGGSFGAGLGVFLAAVLVMGSGVIPNAAEPVEGSALGMRIISLVPRFHENMESMGLPLPKLVQLPTDYRDELHGINQGLQFVRMNASRLDGSTCIHCRASVDFEGYHFSRGTLMSPRYRCPECSRTSDGCQTFEGFHTIYGGCPVPLAEEGLQFDCGVWENGWWTVPHGRCPVCGEEYRPAEHAARRPVRRMFL
jgi:hypothetical protein